MYLNHWGGRASSMAVWTVLLCYFTFASWHLFIKNTHELFDMSYKKSRRDPSYANCIESCLRKCPVITTRLKKFSELFLIAAHCPMAR